MMNHHHLPVRFWLQAVAILAGVDGAIWLLSPEFVQSSAYDFARNVLPQRGWAGVFLTAWVCASVALVDTRWISAQIKTAAAILACTIYGAAAATIGLSIAVLTLQGAQSALTGASKWWLPFAISVRALARPPIADDPT